MERPLFTVRLTKEAAEAYGRSDVTGFPGESNGTVQILNSVDDKSFIAIPVNSILYIMINEDGESN